MRIIAVIIGLAAAFWAGHAYSSYRTADALLPAVQRSQALHLASMMLRSVDVLDAGDTATLRRKLLAVAKSQIEPLPETPTNWQTVLAPPLMDDEAIAYLRSKNEADGLELHQKYDVLASSPGMASSDVGRLTGQGDR